ncbi:uncharacterized protein N7515_001674 [Penicillium bovifimosum]|uniref:Uncharacterized protein n=1 Tax=Penicillium bovifimosum TaxID=126998 RepID=A0A9W9HA42_9EURO|nr:uncharacterized protein N7515_001674 [Penicillium bovifimosum]KAJ5142887.1 hypothetical protein N7515_001674 [Penicillium bovifimosum]
MSPSTKLPTSPPTTDDTKLTHYYKQASKSRWDLYPLFQSFLQTSSAETIKAVQDRRLLISWDLQAIHFLRTFLQKCVLAKVPADAIGAFLITILYKQDYHLDYSLTIMIWTGHTQVHVARCLLALYQIRDETGVPIWDDLSTYSESDSKVSLVTNDEAVSTADVPCCSPAMQRPDLKWPVYLGLLCESEVDALVSNVEKSRHQDEDSLPPCSSAAREEDVETIQALRRFELCKNEFLADLPLGDKGRTAAADKTNGSQRHRSVSFREPLPVSLPSLVKPGSAVRVSTFQPDIRSVEQGSLGNSKEKGKAYMRLFRASPAARDLVQVPCQVLPLHVAPARLRRRAGVEDLRKASAEGA